MPDRSAPRSFVMNYLSRAAAVSTVVFLVSVPTAQAQTTWFVDVTGVPPGTGTALDPYTSLQYAIDQGGTLSGDTLLVLPGTYAEAIDLGSKRLTIESVAGSGSTFIDAGGAGTAVRVHGGTPQGSSLVGITITGGVGNSGASGVQGGGVWCSAATLRIQDCVIEGCSAESGGGIFADRSDLELLGCVLRDIPCGGGIRARMMTRFDVTATQFTRINPLFCNVAGIDLGAIYAKDSDVSLAQCEFIENHANFFEVDPEHASGVALIQCNSVVIDCDFSLHGISPSFPFEVGGALAVVGGEASILACDFFDNRPEFRGGALAIRTAQVTVEDCKFENNSSFDEYWGGALYTSTSGVSDVVVRRCEFVGNHGGDGGGAYVGGGQAYFEECRFENNSAHGKIYEQGSGGGVYVHPGASALLQRCVLVGNVAEGNDFQNPAGGKGGAAAGAAVLNHCTVVANQALDFVTPGEGGGVYDATVANSILWGNLPDALGGSALADFSDVQGGAPGTGNIDALPRFWLPQAGDFHLRFSSPCIDAGDPFGIPDDDGSDPDMGAFPFDDNYCLTSEATAYCTGKLNSNGCTPTLSWSGTAGSFARNDFVLEAEGVINNTVGLLLWGREAREIPFQGGTLCLGGPLRRGDLLFSGGNPSGSDCSGKLRFHVSRRFLQSPPIDGFESLHAQFWYRDPSSSYGAGLTNAVQFGLCPIAEQ